MWELLLTCEGLTPREGRSLLAHLKQALGEDALSLELGGDEDVTYTREVVQAALPHLHLIIKAVKLSVDAIATGVLTEAGRDLYKRYGAETISAVTKWLNSKTSEKSNVPVKITILGPDGRVLHEIERHR